MRRQLFSRRLIFATATAVMALYAASVHAQSARTDAGLEIVGSVGTTAITDVFERIELGLSDLPLPDITRTTASYALRGDLHVGLGEPDHVASISRVDAASAPESRCTALSRATCGNVVLAQYN